MNYKGMVPIYFACDEKYAKYTCVTIKSIIENASREYEYIIYILHRDITQEAVEKVKKYEEEGFSIEFVNVKDSLAEFEKRLPLRDYYSMTTYYRLFIADMFPQYDKVIYIDSDTIVLGDISILYQYNLSKNLVGAVRDQVVCQNEIFSEYAEQVLGVNKNLYFNAGMLLMNIKEFRNQKVLDQFVDLLCKYTFVVAQDQDYLNIICKDKILWLGPEWNLEVYGELACTENINIIHFNLASKPWHYKDVRLADYFWKYAKMTYEYDDIQYDYDNYTEKERRKDDISGKSLVDLALSEINNGNNYYNLIKKENTKDPERLKVLEKISMLEQECKFDVDVESDPPGEMLMPEDVEYVKKSISAKLRTKYAFNIARWYMNTLAIKKQFIVKDVEGIENLKGLKSGAVITCNHFNALDSFAMQVAYDKSKHRRRKLYRVIKEGNYTSFPGFYGFLMRNCNTLPLSSNYDTMKKFMKGVDKLLNKGHFVLIYPEQSMWWNYKKPKPLKKGAYTFAAKNNVPVLPCFITMQDSDICGPDGFFVQEYTIHISRPIYPDKKLSFSENVERMRKKNYKIWRAIYEDSYGIPLEYTCGNDKVEQMM